MMNTNIAGVVLIITGIASIFIEMDGTAAFILGSMGIAMLLDKE